MYMSRFSSTDPVRFFLIRLGAACYHPMMDVKEQLEGLGAALLQIREGAGLSQRGLQKSISALGGNIAHTQISRYERGQDRPAAENLMWLLAGCGADLCHLQAALDGGLRSANASQIAEIKRRLAEISKRHGNDGVDLDRLVKIVSKL